MLAQVQFSRDGNYLYTGARRDPDIFCWDVRYTSDVVYRLQRQTSDTNQRIQFDIVPYGRHLATGMPLLSLHRMMCPYRDVWKRALCTCHTLWPGAL
jgi:WD40 repeat protein